MSCLVREKSGGESFPSQDRGRWLTVSDVFFCLVPIGLFLSIMSLV